MEYPNLSSLAVCGRASPASRNEELSDARLSNRSDPQAGKISPRIRRRRRLAPSARLHRLRLHSRPHRTLGAGAGTAKRRVAPKPGGEFQRCSPRWRRQPRSLTTAFKSHDLLGLQMTTALLVFMEIREVLGAPPVSTARHFRPTHWHPPQAGKGHAPKASQRWQRHSNLASVHPLLSCDERRHRPSRWAAEPGNLPENMIHRLG